MTLRIERITETFPMSKVNDALERLRAGKTRYRIVLANDRSGGRSEDVVMNYKPRILVTGAIGQVGQQVMASVLTLPKVKPIDVVRQVLSAVEAGRDEGLADDMTRRVKTGLSGREGIYLNIDPEHAVHAARSEAQLDPAAIFE